MKKTIMFTKDKVVHQISGVPEDAIARIVNKEPRLDLLIESKDGTTLAYITDVQSFADAGLAVSKLKKRDFIDE